MAYAVFKDEPQLSTSEEALKKADEAGLVDAGTGMPALEDDLSIKPCAPDIDNNSDDDLDWSMEPDRSADQRRTKDRTPEVQRLRRVIASRDRKLRSQARLDATLSCFLELHCFRAVELPIANWSACA
jgi:hypothetical protein